MIQAGCDFGSFSSVNCFYLSFDFPVTLHLSSFPFFSASMENEGAGSVEKTGFGKYAVYCKTRSLSGKRGFQVENTKYHFFFSPTYEFSSLK